MLLASDPGPAGGPLPALAPLAAPAHDPTPHAPHSFHPFTLTHLIVVLVCAAAIILSCYFGRLWSRTSLHPRRDDPRERQLRGVWGGFVIGVNLWSIVYWFLPARFDIRESLPLQLCDLACMVAAVAMLTRQRWAHTLLFFWGIGLSTQAFITPTLKYHIGHMEFWLFWLVHLSIVGSAIYLLAVRRYRPTIRDLIFAIAISAMWVGAMLILNPILGSNYGYVANTLPQNRTVIDALGPWPLRIFILGGIVIAIFVGLWAAARRKAGQK
jgi:hypothetical integral membrane protein (TIGR02206 family)